MILFWSLAASLLTWMVCRIIASNEREVALATWNRQWHYERQALVSQHAEQWEALKADYRQMHEEFSAERERLAAELAEHKFWRAGYDRHARDLGERERELGRHYERLNVFARSLQQQRESIDQTARGYAHAVIAN